MIAVLLAVVAVVVAGLLAGAVTARRWSGAPQDVLRAAVGVVVFGTWVVAGLGLLAWWSL